MAGNDYQIDFSAADPILYDRLFPELIANLPGGRASDPLSGAAESTSVESLAPTNLALAQIVPFEFRISVDQAGAVSGDTITITAGWETVTTNGGLFGFNGNLGVIAAFIDASDPSASGDTDAIVSDFAWTMVDTEIQGTFEINNLDPAEEVVLEAWLVLQDEIPVRTTGTVQSRLISAETSRLIETGDAISTGNQTIPLLRVKDFFSTPADLPAVVSDSNVLLPEDDLAQVNRGDHFTYMIIATNNSGDLNNTDSITEIDDDPDLSSNTNVELTDVLELNANEVLTTSNSTPSGVFVVDETGQIEYDFLYDGGWFQGELAVFSLVGMEAYEYGSLDYLQEAAARAISNSTQGRILTSDHDEGARFDFKVDWEKNFNQGNYQGIKTFAMNPRDEVGLMLVQHTTFADIYNDPSITSRWGKKVLFSTDTNQVATVDNNGTLAFEDVKVDNNSDRDYNDFVFQVTGMTGSVTSLDELGNSDRNWLNTEDGQELLEYANRPQFETGTFTVNSTGKFEFDYLYDGGWYQGELAVFSLKGMEVYEPGSVEFLTEATRRALTNSNQGRILISDRTEGAYFSDKLSWENDFNIDSDAYQGVRSFEMEAGDELAFMLVQHTTVQDIYQHPYSISQWGKKVLFSTDTNQVVAVDNNGTLAFEDIVVGSGNSDYDYNDFIFQVRGLESNNTVSFDEVVNPNRDWRNTGTGVNLLAYANRTSFNEGVFEVGETGEVTFDYLYDGGWFQGELAVFSLAGMDIYEPGSDAFIAEATRRALTNSEQGYILAKDRTEGARFTKKMDWENNFNLDPGSYQGVKTFTMNPGEKFAFMLVQHTTVSEITDPNKIGQWGKMPIFSTPEANPEYAEEGLMVDVDGNGTYAFEDVLVNGDRDYNDFVFQIKGAKGAVSSIDLYSNSDRDWRDTTVGQEILEYSNRALFDKGVFQVEESGEVIIDFLYDGGYYEGAEVGIFSLNGMDIYEIGSNAFIEEAIKRAQSNSSEGYTIVQDLTEGAKFNANLNWESNYNNGEYQGRQTFLMNPGDTFGLVLVPDGTLDEALSAPDWAMKKDPLFSMSDANINNQIQFADIKTDTQGTLVGFEDVRLDMGSNQDYNDIVLAIEGVQRIGIDDIGDIMASNRNWLETEVGHDIIGYFDHLNSI